MKTKLLLLLVSFGTAGSLSAQGPLTPPPGPPVPTMKSLDQIEARTPISTLPYTINASGSYYLTQNLSVSTGNGITITASDVSLDLNGFTISSTASNPSGAGIIWTNSLNNIAVRNGVIKGQVVYAAAAFSGGGFNDGINAAAVSRGIVISDVIVSGCGNAGIDLALDDSNIVSRCIVHNTAGLGIRAGTVTSSTARLCGYIAIAAETVESSVGESVGASMGISATSASTCKGTSVGSWGISAVTAINCVGQSTASIGLTATNATNCRGISTNGVGLSVATATNCSGISTTAVGMSSVMAQHSTGSTTSGAAGLNATVASYCRGTNSSGGTAINCSVAIGCSGSGAITASSGKFLGTP